MILHVIVAFVVSTVNCEAGPRDELGSSENEGLKASTAASDFIPVIPDECAESTYCAIKSPNYPQAYIDEYFKDHVVIQLNENEDLELPSRSNDPAEGSLCQAKSMTLPMHEIKSKDGKWYHLIQSHNWKYNQTLRVEICSAHPREGDQQSCDDIAKFDSSVRSFCRQQFTYRFFVVLSHNGSFVTKPTEVPTCCLCSYTDNTDSV